MLRLRLANSKSRKGLNNDCQCVAGATIVNGQPVNHKVYMANDVNARNG